MAEQSLVDFDVTDGLTPLQTQKLNTNFRIISLKLNQLIANQGVPDQILQNIILNKASKADVDTALAGKVSKSGDTISGTLTADGTYFCAKNTNIDRDGADPSEAVAGNARFFMRDKDGEFIGQMRMYEETSGRMSLQLMVGRENTSNSEVTNTLSIRVDKNGKAEYGVGSPANFRSALGLVPDVLYNSTSGNNGEVTLSSSSANYVHMRIYFYTKGSNSEQVKQYNSVDVYEPNGKYVALSAVGPSSSSDTAIQLRTRLAYISANKIKNTRSLAATFGGTQGVYNEVYITRVEAWKI